MRKARSPVIPMTVMPSSRSGALGNVICARFGTNMASRPMIEVAGIPASMNWSSRRGASPYVTATTVLGENAAAWVAWSWSDVRFGS